MRKSIARAQTLDDVRDLARRRVPRPIFDFVDGAAEDEVTAARSRAAFRQVEFMPRALTGVEPKSPATTIFGRPATMPVVLAPTGFTRLSHRLGEIAAVRAAAEAGVPFCLSTFGTVSLEELADAAPDADRWFQVYVMRDRKLTASLVDRARATGCSALVLTVDLMASGKRVRDLRNGFSIPPRLTARSLVQFASHPRWSLDLLTSPPLDLANMRTGTDTDLWQLLRELADVSFSFDDVPTFRRQWDGPLVLKGIMTVADAQRAADLGVDAIVLSNHGGRQLDRVPVGLELLERVLDAVGDRVEVHVDGGVRSGADVVAAAGLGARACFVGRPWVFGLQAGGQDGGRHVLDLLHSETDRTLRLLGVTGIDEVDRSMVRLRTDVRSDDVVSA